MRKIDKKLNLAKANLLTEQRYLASKGFESENLDEEYYDSLGEPTDGKYVDASELVGQELFFHTNRTNRNAKRNGMIGTYGVTSTGRKAGKAELLYTNEVKVVNAKFQASEKATERTQATGDRTVHAGVTGRVVPLDGMGSGIPADFNPFGENPVPWFFLKDDKEKKEIVSADEVYFLATEGGDWKFLVKNPVYGKRKLPSEADKQTSMEFPTEEPELAEDVEFLESPMINDLVIVKTQSEYILVNRLDNTIEAQLGPIDAYFSKEHLCSTALRLHSELFESYENVYTGGGKIIGPLSACKKGGLEEEVLDEERNPKQDTYFETLSEALDAVREYAAKLGFEVDEKDMWTYFGTGGIGYGETEKANIRLLKNGQPILDGRGKEANRYIRVSIYRMDSGRYELTKYKTF